MQSLKLIDQLRNAILVKHYSYRTEQNPFAIEQHQLADGKPPLRFRSSFDGMSEGACERCGF